MLYGTVRARDTSGQVDGADLTAAVRAQNALTLKLFAALRAEQPQANLAVGGYTVHQVLGMLYAGRPRRHRGGSGARAAAGRSRPTACTPP